MEKEYLYIGHYTDVSGNYILKIGTTNDLERRRKEHTRNYRKTPNCPMPADAEFVYDFKLKLSKYNTLRYEDSNKAKWQEEKVGDYMRNDRFVCQTKPEKVEITIRKTYIVQL